MIADTPKHCMSTWTDSRLQELGWRGSELVERVSLASSSKVQEVRAECLGY